MAFVSLAVIALVAFTCPFIASAIPGKPIPETVFLLVAGAILGPRMLGVIRIDESVTLVSELGLAFLFLLAGFEIDPDNVTGREGRWGMGTWLVTFGFAWLAVRFTPWFSVSHIDGLAVTLALTSTALGTLMPILRERSLVGTRIGDSILAYGTWGELGPVLAMSVLLSARTGVETFAVLGAFAAMCVLLAVVPARSRRAGRAFFRFVQERADTTSQTLVRLTVLILVTLVAFSAVFDLDIVLGAFAAGFVLRFIIPEGNHTLETKLDGLAYGFLIPVFFTVSGAKIDLTAVASQPVSLAGFIVALLLIRAVPIVVATGLCPVTRDVTPHGRLTVALYCTTALPIIVAVTSVAVGAGAMSQTTASVLVAAGAVTVFVMPLLAQFTYRVVDAAPATAVIEVAHDPKHAASIIREHVDVAKLLERQHQIMTSRGYGRSYEGAPTWESIARHLREDAAARSRVDDLIVDAAHQLADRAHDGIADPASLTPQERHRLERARTAVREYRARMLELNARDNEGNAYGRAIDDRGEDGDADVSVGDIR